MSTTGIVLADLNNAVMKRLDVFLESKGGQVRDIICVPFGSINDVAQLIKTYGSTMPVGFLSFPEVSSTMIDGGASGLVSQPNFNVPYRLALCTNSRDKIHEKFNWYADVFQLFSDKVMSRIFADDENPTGWRFVRIEFDSYGSLYLPDPGVFIALAAFRVKVYAACMDISS